MTENPTIRAVIWDMGGVILRTDDRTPRSNLAKKFNLTYEDLDRIVFNSDNSDLATRGIITQRMYWENIRRSFNLKPQEMRDFRNQFFEGDKEDTYLLDFIQALRPRYRIGLLSNAWSDIRKNVTQYYTFLDAFDVTVFSAEVGLAKPEPQIYNLTLEKLEVAANEAVFIDDLESNVEGARQVGLFAIQFLNTSQVVHDLKTLFGIC